MCKKERNSKKKKASEQVFFITRVKNLFYHNYSFIRIFFFYFVIKAGDTSHTDKIFDKTILCHIKTFSFNQRLGQMNFVQSLTGES